MGRTYNDDELTDWQWSTQSSSGSNKIEIYTVTAVSALLAAIVTRGASLSQEASTVISALAGQAVSVEMPVVYYYQDVYFKFLLNTDPPLPRAERTVTTFYSDSGRTSKIGDTVVNDNYS